MRVLLIAIGNPLRGDDGVAHHVAARLDPPPDAVMRTELQLTPELAPEVARAATVVFIDADVDALVPSLEPVAPGAGAGAPLIHAITPRDVVLLAEKLYGFGGRAWICRLPVADFDRDGLSPEALAGAEAALQLLREFLKG